MADLDLKIKKGIRRMRRIVALAVLSLSFPSESPAQEIGSASYCDQLAVIGLNAFRTKSDGYSMGQVLQQIANILRDQPKKLAAAQGVVIAIYGDSSISSSSEAYDIVYAACME